MLQIPYTAISGFDTVDCLVDVISYCGSEGNSRTWDSPDDYLGWSELEFEIKDLDGNPWPELQRDLGREEIAEIEEKVRAHYEWMNNDY